MSHFLGAMILTSRGFQDIKYNIPVRRFVRPSVRPSVILSDFHSQAASLTPHKASRRHCGQHKGGRGDR